VDDDDRNLRLLEAYLSPERYVLLKANRGAEAIEIVRRERPDLVLLDGMMPQMSASTCADGSSRRAAQFDSCGAGDGLA